ncbi:hypothetical protein D3C76_1207540 [compost metagenome]
MATTGNSRVCGEIGELPGIRGFQHFHEHTARVAVLGYLVGERCRRQVTQVGGVKRPHQTGSDRLGDQRRAAGTKCADLLGNSPHSGGIHRLDIDLAWC